MNILRDGDDTACAIVSGRVRDLREDRYYLCTHPDRRGWTIAVTAGIGADGDKSAQAAADAISGPACCEQDLLDVLCEADASVRNGRDAGTAAASVALASWTPDGGLWTGWAGDSAVMVLSADGGGWTSPAHLDPDGRICRYLGSEESSPAETADATAYCNGSGPSIVLVATPGILDTLRRRASRINGLPQAMCDSQSAVKAADRTSVGEALDAVEHSLHEQAAANGLSINATAVAALIPAP